MSDITRPSIAVIGGGPAGLMAAERLAGSGTVTIYDRMPSVGRKFLMAGRGGLNLTHGEPLDVLIACYGPAAGFLAPSLRDFAPVDLRAWCAGLGQETFVGSSGRIFPAAMKASPLLRAWLVRLRGQGVGFAMGHDWQGWDDAGDLIFDGNGHRHSMRPDATVLALGGASWPRLGADGGWTKPLVQKGVSVMPLRPANCGFTVDWSDHIRDRFAGTPVKPVSLSFAGQIRQGEIMITRDGVEGGLIYAFSSALREAISTDSACEITLDLKPGMARDDLAARLAAQRGGQSLATRLRKGAGLDQATIALLREGRVDHALPDDPAGLAALIKAKPLRLTGTAGLARAISTAGGVAFEALDGHFMLKDLPGVFAIGEMVDWEAPTGGYLLQGCFSMAARAAAGVRRYLGEK